MSAFFINLDTLEYPLHISQVNKIVVEAKRSKKSIPKFEPVNRVIQPTTKPGTKLVRGPAIKTESGWEETWTDIVLSEDEITAQKQKKDLANRQTRDMLLRASDWTQLQDAPVDKQAWKTYRQLLRDLPNSPEWPEVVWPEKPTS